MLKSASRIPERPFPSSGKDRAKPKCTCVHASIRGVRQHEACWAYEGR